jgi:maltooligosyltrehalose trehalohydrolase
MDLLSDFRRRQPVGAEVQPQRGVHFRLWAPERGRVELALDPRGPAPESLPLQRDSAGYWTGLHPRAAAGTRYGFHLDGQSKLYPDPASRFQPEGPHGPSEVIDPGAFPWTDTRWAGLTRPGQVFYELHIGTFTRAGTWEAAAARLPHLCALGATVLEVMPVSEFPGSFGWGYDGVDIYAPYHGYGRPDQFRSFVDQAHRLGLAVMLDVVYNHFGPNGNYLGNFWSGYFSDKATEWGRALNYDGKHSRQAPAATRELIADNAAYWIEEFHLDGLRLDATQSIFDESADHIVAELARRARAAAGKRPILIFAENEPQQPHLVRPPEENGHGLDGLWNDDFHHTAKVALTGRNEAYYSDYLGSPQELVSAAKRGYLYQGQASTWQGKPRGASARGIQPGAFAAYLENHDQVANSAHGERLWRQVDAGRFRAMTGLLLLGPWTPLLFQGQEWNASAPFLFFADHEPDLARLVQKGRAEFLSQFPSCGTPEMQARLPAPHERATFERCILDWSETERPGHAQALALHRDLLALRRRDPVIQAQGQNGVHIDGAVLADQAFALRFQAVNSADDDRLLIVNLGRDRSLRPMPEPLLAPPQGAHWRVAWSSEDHRYGGSGTPPIELQPSGMHLPGHAALLLTPEAPGSSDIRKADPG